MQRFLVTSGFQRLEESKVRALGFAGWFAAIYIDALGEGRQSETEAWAENRLHGSRGEG